MALGLLTACLLGNSGLLVSITATTLRQGGAIDRHDRRLSRAGAVDGRCGHGPRIGGGPGFGIGPSRYRRHPLIAGLFGFVTGSGNATNALLMTSQIGLAAQHGLSALWIASIVNVAAGALTMLSPARVAMARALAGERGGEGKVYAKAWGFGAIPIAILAALCGALLLASRV